MAYAIYLHLSGLKISEHQMQQWVKKWLVMSILTGRYSSSAETAFERDIRQISEKGEACLEQIELAELNEGFWKHGWLINLILQAAQTTLIYAILLHNAKNQEHAFFYRIASIFPSYWNIVATNTICFPKPT